jgi:hypothetical protein
MMNIELARILQADREREIEAELRARRLVRSTDGTKPAPTTIRPGRGYQRPASSGAASR